MSELGESSTRRLSIRKRCSRYRMCKVPRTIYSHLTLNHLRFQQSLHCRCCLVTGEVMISNRMAGSITVVAYLGLDKTEHRVCRLLVALFYRTIDVLVWPFAEPHVANDVSNLLSNQGLPFFWNNDLKVSLLGASTLNVLTIRKLFYVFEIRHGVRFSSVNNEEREDIWQANNGASSSINNF